MSISVFAFENPYTALGEALVADNRNRRCEWLNQTFVAA